MGANDTASSGRLSRAGDGGTVFVQAARNFPWKASQSLGVPTVVVAIENYGRVGRLVDRKVDVDPARCP